MAVHLAAMPSRELAVYANNLWFARRSQSAVDVPDTQEGDLVVAVKQLLAKDVPSRGKGQGHGKGGCGGVADMAAGMVARGEPGITCATAMPSLVRRPTVVRSCSSVPGWETRAGRGNRP